MIWLASLVIAVTTAAPAVAVGKGEPHDLSPAGQADYAQEVLLGKFLGCWLAMRLHPDAVLLASSGWFPGAEEHELPAANYLQAIWLHWMHARHRASPWPCWGPSLLSRRRPMFPSFCSASSASGRWGDIPQSCGRPSRRSGGLACVCAVYFAIPHLEIFDLRERVIHGWESVPGAASAWPRSMPGLTSAMLLRRLLCCFAAKGIELKHATSRPGIAPRGLSPVWP